MLTLCTFLKLKHQIRSYESFFFNFASINFRTIKNSCTILQIFETFLEYKLEHLENIEIYIFFYRILYMCKL